MARTGYLYDPERRLCALLPSVLLEDHCFGTTSWLSVRALPA